MAAEPQDLATETTVANTLAREGLATPHVRRDTSLDRVLDDCPAARCRLQAGVTVAPLHFEIEPAP